MTDGVATKVLEVLRVEQPCSRIHLQGALRRTYPNRSWGAHIVSLALKRLQYRSLVEYDVVWRTVD